MADYKLLNPMRCTRCLAVYPKRYVDKTKVVFTDQSAYICESCYIKLLQEELRDNPVVSDIPTQCNCCKDQLQKFIESYLKNNT